LLTPISRLLVLIGNALTPGRGFRNGPFASEIELREVVDLAQQRGVVADEDLVVTAVAAARGVSHRPPPAALGATATLRDEAAEERRRAGGPPPLQLQTMPRRRRERPWSDVANP